jgi:hypothetical protein
MREVEMQFDIRYYFLTPHGCAHAHTLDDGSSPRIYSCE